VKRRCVPENLTLSIPPHRYSGPSLTAPQFAQSKANWIDSKNNVAGLG
jgi:hypothetical protein